jgi:hypothetical protein
MPKIARLMLLLALGVLPTAGCVVRVPNGVPATGPTAAAPTYATSWVERVKLQIERPAAGPRVASAGLQRWHRVQLTVGRLDGTQPPMTMTLDPFDQKPARGLEGFVPGDDYWVQVNLVQVASSGAEWVVGSGRLGGAGQIVRFHAGPNGLPIPIRPAVAGGQLDPEPTPLRKKSRSSGGSGSFILVGSSTSTSTSTVIEESIVILDGDNEDGDEDESDDMDWLFGDDDEDDDADDEADDDTFTSDEDTSIGDWLDSFSALKRAK